MLDMWDGLLIEEQYEVKECIGRGGFGDVWRGYDLMLKRDVAIKRCDFQTVQHRVEEGVEEAQKIAAINSANVVTVYRTAKCEDQVLIFMEYMAGGNLHDRLRTLSKDGRWMSVSAAFRLLRSLLLGLQAAHGASPAAIIHRDLKPQNILFDIRGNAKIADFGLASIGRVEAIETTRSGGREHPGTFGYKSPEQLKGTVLDHRTDLFNVGLIGYLLFGAVHPYVCQRLLFDYKEMVLSPYRALPRLAGPTLPNGIDEFVSVLLSEKPDDRYKNAGDALVGLEAAETAYDKMIFDRVLALYDALKSGSGASTRVTPDELARGVLVCRKSGFYIQGAFLYEKSGIDLSCIDPADRLQVETDYNFCRRRAGKEVPLE